MMVLSFCGNIDFFIAAKSNRLNQIGTFQLAPLKYVESQR
jgi:hypothetical protein